MLLPGDSGFDAARSIWNSMILREPALIVRCKTTHDVINAVNFAQDQNLVVSVKGGGHNIAGNAVCNGGLMIDLSEMQAVEVDPEKKTVRVEGGCLLGMVDEATQQHGLAVPAGVVSTTGVAGLTLGGGFGWISRKYGLSIDNLLEAEVVTADGNCITASKKENPNLFWGLRGGGGNFGIVTRFTFRLQPVGQVYSGLIVHPFSAARELLQFHRDFIAQAPDELTLWVIIRHAPPLPFLPEAVHGQLVVVVAFCYVGDEAAGAQVMAPYRAWGSPLGEHVGMNPFADWQKSFDGLSTSGARNYWKSHYLHEISDAFIDTVIPYAADFPSPDCEVLIPQLGGAISRVPEDETAFTNRQAPTLINLHTRWEKAADDEKNIRWAREFFEALKPFSTGGVYVNFIGEEDETRVHDAYSAATWKKLVSLKVKYDPQNFFHMNQNIRPSQYH